MSLTLDARQRAMLLEMGVRVWQPRPRLSLNPPSRPCHAPAPIPGKPSQPS